MESSSSLDIARYVSLSIPENIRPAAVFFFLGSIPFVLTHFCLWIFPQVEEVGNRLRNLSAITPYPILLLRVMVRDLYNYKEIYSKLWNIWTYLGYYLHSGLGVFDIGIMKLFDESLHYACFWMFRIFLCLVNKRALQGKWNIYYFAMNLEPLTLLVRSGWQQSFHRMMAGVKDPDKAILLPCQPCPLPASISPQIPQ